MADAMWLNPSLIAKAVAGRTFGLDMGDVGEDAVSLRLRSEILEFLHSPIVDSTEASVRLTTDCRDLESGEAFRITESDERTTIEGNTSIALMYGLYAWLRGIITGMKAFDSPVVEHPSQALRMIDHWDQIDGSVERGYAGESIFFGRAGSNEHFEFVQFPERDESDAFRGDIERVIQYARFCASIGINAVALNNVNVRGLATWLVVHPLLDRVAFIAKIFSSFGIRTFLAVNFAAPKKIGGLDTSDPLDPQVREWWKRTVDDIYCVIADFGGFLVKADSEGEPGPYQYGRTHADGANMLAEALAPHNGVVIWRTFVYNSQTDWRDRSLDRARAAYDNFHELDGKFADNAILQIKFGPIDFQTREPLNPLIGGMAHTNVMIEFEMTAEYLGHQIDVNYVLPQWLGMIHTCTGTRGARAEAASYICSNAANMQNTGFAAVSNVGMDENWTGNTLSQANFYGYGRMCWDNGLDAATIADEWLALSFPQLDGAALSGVRDLLLTSNRTYEKYTAPLGVGFMVQRGDHYGPGINDYEYDRWGTYHYADRNGVGVDRTVATGTGYTAQYAPETAVVYEQLDTCPDELLLFFHHVPYTHMLHSGVTVIQHIYDTHFAGAAKVDEYIMAWDAARGKVPESDWHNVAERLQRQKANAIAWRDQVNTYFHRMSGVDDAENRAIYA